jgi:hypothetical protein
MVLLFERTVHCVNAATGGTWALGGEEFGDLLEETEADQGMPGLTKPRKDEDVSAWETDHE